MASEVTVVIKTMCRDTLARSIASARKCGWPVIAVSDGVPFKEPVLQIGSADDHVCLHQLGRPFKHYGAMAFNVGALLCRTRFAAMLDDDDVFRDGAELIVEQAISAQPEIDIWIPGLRYKDGGKACMNGPVSCGNVACPMLRPEVIADRPILHERDGSKAASMDYRHIQAAVKRGWKIGWLKKQVIDVRPDLPGNHGKGER
jgi:hypothetical protein